MMIDEAVRTLSGGPPDPFLAERITMLEALGGIAGVSAIEIEDLETVDDASGRMLVRFQGWSPGLHAIDVTTTLIIRNGSPGVIEGLEALIASQRGRQRLAYGLGLSAPLGDIIQEGSEDEGDLAAVTRHLLVDRDLLALADEDEDDSLQKEIAEGMPGAANTTDYDGGPLCDNCVIWVADHVAGPLAGAIHYLKTGPDVSFDGRRIILSEVAFPEAVIAAAAGRPVSDVIEIHPLLDVRTIVEIQSHDDGRDVWTEISLQPIPVPLHPDAWTDGEEP